MREATPYVTKGSPVSEIGWETPPPESPRLGASAPDPLASQPPSFHRDRKSIPLRMCFVTRSLALADPESRYEWAGASSCGPRAQLLCVKRAPLLSSSLLLSPSSFILMRNLCVKLSFRKMLNPWSQDLLVPRRSASAGRWASFSSAEPQFWLL